MSATVGVGVIGLTGAMGRSVFQHYQQMDQARVVAGLSSSPERARQASAEYGVPVYTDLEDFLRHKGLDAVFVGSPNYLHATHVIAALEAGKPVLSEKPMATTLEDCRRIVQTVNKTGGFLHIGFECRNSLLYTTVRDLIEADELGTVVGATCMYTPGAWGSWLHGADSWKYDGARSGGMFCEKLCHYVDLLKFFIRQEPQSLYCVSAPNVHLYYRDMVDNAHLTLKFDGGAVGQLTFIHARAARPDPDEEDRYPSAGHQLDGLVLGSQATAHWNVWDKSVNVTAFDPHGRRPPWVVKRIDMWNVSAHRLYHDTETEHREFIRRLLAGEGPAVTAADAFQTMRLCFAAEESIRTGRIINLADWP